MAFIAECLIKTIVLLHKVYATVRNSPLGKTRKRNNMTK
jgi:hypothetical protein